MAKSSLSEVLHQDSAMLEAAVEVPQTEGPSVLSAWPAMTPDRGGRPNPLEEGAAGGEAGAATHGEHWEKRGVEAMAARAPGGELV